MGVHLTLTFRAGPAARAALATSPAGRTGRLRGCVAYGHAYVVITANCLKCLCCCCSHYSPLSHSTYLPLTRRTVRSTRGNTGTRTGPNGAIGGTPAGLTPVRVVDAGAAELGTLLRHAVDAPCSRPRHAFSPRSLSGVPIRRSGGSTQPAAEQRGGGRRCRCVRRRCGGCRVRTLPGGARRARDADRRASRALVHECALHRVLSQLVGRRPDDDGVHGPRIDLNPTPPLPLTLALPLPLPLPLPLS